MEQIGLCKTCGNSISHLPVVTGMVVTATVVVTVVRSIMKIETIENLLKINICLIEMLGMTSRLCDMPPIERFLLVGILAGAIRPITSTWYQMGSMY